MLAKSFIAAGALLSMAAAVPMQQMKREIIWETDVEMKYVTVDVTTTIWLEPGETPPTQASPAGNGPPGHYGHKHHHSPPHSPAETSAAPPPPAPTPESTYVAPTTPAAAPTTSTPYVAPAPTTTEAAAPAYSSPAAPQPSSPSSGGGAPSGTTYTGDITYYTPGLGSCGITSSESEDVVALPVAMMTAANPPNPNDNPYCGKMITISYGGKTATAKVVDTCPGCAGDSIDLSPPVFAELADMSEGRVSGVEWWFS